MLERPAAPADARAMASRSLAAMAGGLPDHERAALALLLAGASSNPAQAALGLAPAEALLEPAEIADYQALRREPLRELSIGQAVRSVLTVILKTTRLCNLRCTYCHS